MKRECKCDRCKEKIPRFRDVKKVKKENLCKNCYRKNRIQKRKDMIKGDGHLKKDLRELKRKERRSYYIPKSKKARIEGVPRIRGDKTYRKKKQSSCYLTLQDKQNLLRILMNSGLEFEEAKERISNLIEAQRRIKKEMEDKGKEEHEIKAKQQELLEELWRS